jgi:Ca2+-binding EF-hand superfamily protein/protein-L-isoaspartate O-methyltransferase
MHAQQYSSDRLSEEQVAEFREVFNLFDTNNDGSLSRQEIANAMRTLGLNPTEEELEAIFIKVDADLSGTLEFPEFIEWVAASEQDVVLENDLQAIFKIIDKDGNGTIEVDERSLVLESLRIQMEEEEIAEMMRQADANGDGVIDYHEFALAQWSQIKLTLALVRSLKEILQQYTRLAENPELGFGTTMALPYGKENARQLGYDVSQLPLKVWESSCMCGNPFSLGPVRAGETVIDLGCGAGADLCVAATLVGPSGRVIGVDMTPAMVKKAQDNAALCGFDNIEVIRAPFDSLDKAIPTGVADVVIANGTLNLSPRKKCAFVQAFSCLKAGGHFYLVDMVRESVAYAEASTRPSEAEEGSWCDCVAGAVPASKTLELMESVGFVDVEHVGFTAYRTSDYTVAGTFRAQKPTR